MLTHKPSSPPTLAELRGEIDRIDDALLDLVEARVSASAAIAVCKTAEGEGHLKLRPRREAEVVTRLTRRARAADPEMIGHLWRTLMAYGLQGQSPTAFVLHGDGDRLALQDQVRARFGPAGRLRWAASDAEAIEAARTGEAVAVIHAASVPKLDGDLRVFDTVGTSAVAIGRVAADDVVRSERVR